MSCLDFSCESERKGSILECIKVFFQLFFVTWLGGGGWKEGLERGWERVGEGLGKSWRGVGEGLWKGWGGLGVLHWKNPI